MRELFVFWLTRCGHTLIRFIWYLVIIMASSSQWGARRDWRLAQGAEGWDEWYEKIDHVIKVQDAYIDSLQEELAKIKHDVRQLTATMSVLTNTLPNSSASSSSQLPNPSPLMQHWPLAIPANPILDRTSQPQRPCQHGLEDEFRYAFTAPDFTEFHAFHDPNHTAWGHLQSLATKNDMQFGVLESRFKACNGLRIQRYGKKTKTVRFACTHCGCCTGEIQERKDDGHGGTELSESNDDIAFFWRWLFSVVLQEPCLQQPAVYSNHFMMVPSPPPPPLPLPGINNLVHVPIAPMSPPAQVPLQAQEVPVSSTAASPAPAPQVPMQEPLQADIVEVPLTPALEVPVTSTQEADNEWNIS